MKRWLVLLGAACLAGCMEGNKPVPLERKPLYSRLGGQVKIAPVVDGLITQVAADERLPEGLREPFREKDLAALKRKMLAEIQDVSSKGKRFTPAEQREAVRRLGLTDPEYGALRDDLGKAMADEEVGRAEREELLEMLAPVLVAVLGQKD